MGLHQLAARMQRIGLHSRRFVSILIVGIIQHINRVFFISKGRAPLAQFGCGQNAVSQA
jgi:hypothetical protein